MWNFGTRASVYATATWTRGEEKLDGNSYPADRVPPLFGRFAARIPIADAWMLEPFFYWAGAQRRLSPRDEIDPRMNPEGTKGGYHQDCARIGSHPRRSPCFSVSRILPTPAIASTARASTRPGATLSQISK